MKSFAKHLETETSSDLGHAGLGVFMLCNAKCPGGIKGAGILGRQSHAFMSHKVA